MITIVKGNQKIVCTKGTYLDQYKQLGYLPASEIKEEASHKVASSFAKKAIEGTEDDNEKIASKYNVSKSKKSTTTGKKEEK